MRGTFDRSYYNRKEIDVRYKNMIKGSNEFTNIGIVSVIYNNAFDKFLMVSRDYSGFHIDRYYK
jgi:hypothetical protein